MKIGLAPFLRLPASVPLAASLLVSQLLRVGGAWWGGGPGYLLVSSPRDKTVHYARLLTPVEQARGEQMEIHALVQEGRLLEPTGLAADSLRGLLYVADPAAGAVFVFRVFEEGGFRSGILAAGEPREVLSGITARWVAVDATGALLCSDEDSNRIWMLPAPVAAGVADGTLAPQVVGSSAADALELFNGAALASLNSPQGLAADRGQVFWANGAGGVTNASVVRGIKDTADEHRALAAQSLASNALGASGVCLSSTRVFYTDGASSVFSLSSGGGPIVTVSNGLQEGRGCVYDADGTVFVADEGSGKVYALPGAGASEFLAARPLTLALDAPGAFGLAVLNSKGQGGAAPFLHSFTAAFLLVTLVPF